MEEAERFVSKHSIFFYYRRSFAGNGKQAETGADDCDEVPWCGENRIECRRRWVLIAGVRFWRKFIDLKQDFNHFLDFFILISLFFFYSYAFR